MAEPQSGKIQADGASLHYWTYGQSKNDPVLLVSAGNGAALFFESLALLLSREFFVITFDRRGFYSSTIDSDESLSNILERNAIDCARILETLSPRRPSFVFASSGSATIGFELLQRKPHLVAKLIIHEPILIGLLSSSDRLYLEDIMRKTIHTYTESGSAPAGRLLMPALSSPSDIASLKDAPILKRMKSLPLDSKDVYLEKELEAISRYPLDLENILQWRDQLCLCRGDAGSSALALSPVIKLSSLLGQSLEVFPGGHHGYITHEKSFCEKLMRHLKPRTEKL
ncbi:hypothetical protein MYU51_010375 [Penicillium brevicompactum]